MSTLNHRDRKPSITLNSLDKMQTFVEKNKIPFNLSDDEYLEAERELASLTKMVGEDDANHDICLKYCTPAQQALSDFMPIKTEDNDKRRRKKKVSLRIIAEGNQSKFISISPGLYDLLDEPTHVSFQVKDNVLAIGKGLPYSQNYKLQVEHHGYVVKSASLVDFLCEHFGLLDYERSTDEVIPKPFKTAYSDYKEVVLKLNDDLLTVVFMYIP